MLQILLLLSLYYLKTNMPIKLRLNLRFRQVQYKKHILLVRYNLSYMGLSIGQLRQIQNY